MKQKLGGCSKYNSTFHNLKKNNTLEVVPAHPLSLSHGQTKGEATDEKLIGDSEFLILAYLFSGRYSSSHVSPHAIVLMTSQRPLFQMP